MAKLTVYKCVFCGEEVEEIFKDTEEQPEKLDRICPKCGYDLVRGNNWKNNCHRVLVNDRGGL